MGKKGRNDETADVAISRVTKRIIPINIIYESKRNSDQSGDKYTLAVKAALLNAGGVKKTDQIVSYTFHEVELCKLRFRMEGCTETATFEEIGKYYIGNVLGTARRRVDVLKERVRRNTIELFKSHNGTDDAAMYAYAVEMLQNIEYDRVFKEIAILESLRMMAMKPPTW